MKGWSSSPTLSQGFVPEQNIITSVHYRNLPRLGFSRLHEHEQLEL